MQVTDVQSADPPDRMPSELPLAEARPSPWRLVLLSFLMLFTELALIRWTAANNVYLAYITNFALLASFLGIGVGFLLGSSRRDVSRWAPLALAALVAFVLVFPVKAYGLAGSHQLQGRGGADALPEWLSLSIIFLLVTTVMAGLGQAVARTFSRFAPLEAYRLDIVGSIGGIAIFSLLSFLRLSPVVWGVVVGIGMILLLWGRLRWWYVAAALAVIALLAVESTSAFDQWSPYYKVTAFEPQGTHGVLVVSANNIPHQTVYPVDTLRKILPFYFFPYRHVAPGALDNVLVIGAGTGNDVAVALSEGAKHVDAVEIDPAIAQLGREHNADNPYLSPRVSVHINDGRAYLEQTTKHYGLILFALPDSLTVIGGQSNLGLENYLLTQQAVEAARSHLAPNGTFSMYNYYQPFLLDRYANTLAEVYPNAPCVEVGAPLGGRQQAVLTEDLNGAAPNCTTPWRGARLTPASDDHPFPYLKTPSIPAPYLWTIGLILAASLLLVRVAAGPLRPMARYLDLFWMGAAFLLLETKNVVQFALLFGTTWFVNSLVFAGVLLSVFAAVEVARRVTLPRTNLLYGGLLVALVVAWAVPQESLLSLSPALRFVAAAAIAFAPVFLANLVFAQRFRESASSTMAFGANLLGAIVGGILEYLAFVTGYRFLLVLVAVLYGLAFVFGRRLGMARADA
ncbi:MAG TPA: hypothetical protein VGF64_12070 [Acidimicrobiales bacterium]